MNGSATKRALFAVLWTVIAIVQVDRLLGTPPLTGGRRVKAIILVVLALGLAVGYTVGWWQARSAAKELNPSKGEHVS